MLNIFLPLLKLFLNQILLLRMRFTFFFFLSIIFSGCIQTPELVGVKDFKFSMINDSVVTTESKILIKNNNKYDINIHNFSYDIYIGSQKIGKGFSSDDNNKLKSNEISEVHVLSEFFINKLEDFLSDTITKDSIPIKFKANFRLTFFKIKAKRDYCFFQNDDELIALFFNSETISDFLKVKSVKPVNGDLEKTTLLIEMELINKFPVDFVIETINVNVFNNKNSDTPLGSGDIKNQISVIKNQNVLIPFDVTINNINSISSVFEKIQTNDPKYYIKGNVTIILNDKRIFLPIQLEMPMPGR